MNTPSTVASSGAERRQLTVLFCDLVGSTELSQELDPEDLRELILAYQETVSNIVARYEGHIAQYLGDGVLVYFGHPVAHDNDAERAVRAGYDIVAAMEGRKAGPHERHAKLSVRVGIHTGLVVIGQVGAGERYENLALGDTTNIAARLQGIADPNQIIISQATRKLVPGLFVTRDLGDAALKGIDRSTRIYQVVQPSGMRSRLEASDYLTPFVGRELELALLTDCWDHAQNHRGGGVVVTAEPGFGKSRLLFTLHERMQDAPHTWVECRTSPFGQNSAWQPFIETLQQVFGMKDSDNAKARLSRLELSIDALGFTREDAVPLFASLLSIELGEQYPALQISPELQRRKTMELLIAGTLALSKTQPLILVVEDLHWADPSTIELLALLLDQVPTHSILVVMTARPEFQAPWRIKTHLTALSLRPLRNKEAAQMLGSLADKPLAAEVEARILERAGGVPLFVEEIIRMLLESGQLVERDGLLDAAAGVQDLKIPETLQDSLMARLDRLGEAKLLIQQCAVIGREFSYPLIAALSPLEETTLQQQLKALIDAQLLYPRGSPPDSTYLFKHALIQDSAYNSLLKATRQKLHGAIAGLLEKQFAARAKEEPATVARHFDAANDAENAVRWYTRANDLLSVRGAHAEVVAYADRALELLASLPDSPQRARRELRILLGLSASKGANLGFSHADVDLIRERTAELSQQVDDLMLKASAITHLVQSAYNCADYGELARYADQMSALGDHLQSRALQMGGILFRTFNDLAVGRLDEAQQGLDEVCAFRDPVAIQLSHQINGMDSYTMGMSARSIALWLRGFPDQALDSAAKTEEEARQFKHPLTISTVTAMARPTVLNMRREPQVAMPLALAAAESAGRYGVTTWEAAALIQRGIAACMLDEPESPRICSEAIVAYRARGNLFFLSVFHGMEAAECVRQGCLAEARTALTQAFEMVDEHNERFWEAELYRVKGELALAENPADTTGAEACFDKALEVSRGQQAKSLELRAATSLARLWQKQNRHREARELLQPVYDWFTEGFDTPDLKDAKALLTASA